MSAGSKTRRSNQNDRKSQWSQSQRLQKVMAHAGIGSRRTCEELIVAGRVEIDRQIVTQLGTRVDPTTQDIRVDGVPLRQPRRFYYLVNKPSGVVSTSRDPSGRPRVIDLLDSDQRLFTVGRLDKSSEGLMLVTNDGPLANRLIHPRYQVERVYQVLVAGEPSPDSLRKLRHGVHLAESAVRVARLRVKRRHKSSTTLEMVLTEGRNREIRRMAAKIGHKVLSLKRVGLGPLRLGEMPTGAFRELNQHEVRRLKSFVAQGKSRGNTINEGPKRADPRRVSRKAGASTRGLGAENRVPANRSKPRQSDARSHASVSPKATGKPNRRNKRKSVR